MDGEIKDSNVWNKRLGCGEMVEPRQNWFLSVEPLFLYITEEETISATGSSMEAKTLSGK